MGIMPTWRIFFCLCLLLALGVAGACHAQADEDATRIVPPAPPQPGLRLYVAPGGSDDSPGTEDRPFATLARARDEIRTIKQRGGLPSGGVAVTVKGGLYTVRQTLELTTADTGAAEAPIVYRAADGEKPVFSGGLALSGFTPVTDEAVRARLPEEARDKVVRADLKALGVSNVGPLVLGGFASGNGFKTYAVIELFCNGDAMQMARYPNEGVLYTAGVAEPDGHTIHGLTGSKTGRILYEGDRPARWKDERDAILYGYWFFDWADSHERIASIDTEKHEIAFTKPYHSYGYRKGARYYAINLLSEIDMPGEWYLDRQNLAVYFYPPSDPAGAEISLSLLAAPLVQMTDVSHVRFEGLTWELGAGDAILVSGGERCLFAGCTVRRCGGNGISIHGGVNHGILSCDVYSMGRGGTIIAGGSRKTLEPGGHYVANCDIHHLSRIDHTYTPAVLVEGAGNRVFHNRMHHINSSALRVEGNDHLIARNEVHDVLLESDDQGGADMFGNPTFRGNVYRENYWHHIGNWRGTEEDLSCGQAGIRLDDAISGVLIQGNIFHRCASGKLGFGGVQIHGGKDNVVENNIFAECTAAISFSPWDDARWKELVAKSMEAPQIDAALYLQRYPQLAALAEGCNVNTIRRNLVWKCGQFTLRERGVNILQDNKESGDDGLFADATAGDFALTAAGTAAAPPEFTPIPVGDIGLYADVYRPTVPAAEIAAARRGD